VPSGLSQQVGGRLAQFAERWHHINADSWVIRTVTHGYLLEFTDRPPATVDVRQTPLPNEGPKRQALLLEVQALLDKNAVYPISERNIQPGFAAIFFLAPKKSGQWRPIINLKPLNVFIKPKHFRMEHITAVLNARNNNTWATSIDLRDAYLHIPIHPSHQRWLRFKVGNQAYAFRCLPFGLSTAPRVFTRVVKSVAAYLRRQGITIYVYLDDWLITAPTFSLAVTHTHRVIQTAEYLGFLINRDKSHLTPTQRPTYLGTVLDLVAGRVTPTLERVDRLRTSVQSLIHPLHESAFAWLQVLGLMASLVDIVPWCRLRMRPLQIHLIHFYRPRIHPLSRMVPMTDIVRQELVWWLDPHNILKGVQFPALSHQLTLVTDASSTGWGGHIGSRVISGHWSAEESQVHINIQELLAVRKSLEHFQDLVRHKRILIKSDNATVVCYINKQGGTKSPSLCLYTRSLFLWCIDNDVQLRSIHIPGVDNSLADNLSRGISLRPTEWALSRPVASLVFSVMWMPTIDLFASRHNHQLPVYCSRGHDERAYAVDALSIDWSGMAAYAFPPYP